MVSVRAPARTLTHGVRPSRLLDRETGQPRRRRLEASANDQRVADHHAGDDAVVATAAVGAATREVRLGSPDLLDACLGANDHAGVAVVVRHLVDVRA